MFTEHHPKSVTRREEHRMNTRIVFALKTAFT